jgi:hypothetical protein
MDRHGVYTKRIGLWGLTTLAALLVVGCFSRTHDFQIRFDDVYGLRKGAPVYFDDAVVGEVREIEYTDAGRFLVSVAIRKQFASAATDASRFYIDTDPHQADRRVIRVVQLKPGGRPIAEDAVVDGQTRYAVLYEQFARRLGANIAILESGINAFLRELQGIPTDEQIKEIDRQLDAIIADLGHMSRAMKDRLENEILPLIREKIEELRKRLAGSGQEKDLDPLEQKMDTIDNRLST